MELRFGRLNIGTLVNEFRRQTDRQLARQRQCGQIEVRRRPIARCATKQDSQRVPGNTSTVYTFQPSL